MAEVKTLAQFQAELDGKFAKLEQRIKTLESRFGELKVLKSRGFQHHHGDNKYSQDFTKAELEKLGLKFTKAELENLGLNRA